MHEEYRRDTTGRVKSKHSEKISFPTATFSTPYPTRIRLGSHVSLLDEKPAINRLSDCRLKLKCDGTWWRTGGEWRGNWKMEWVASTLHTTSEHGVSSITTADAHTSAASCRLNWRPPADLNGLVRFAERRDLVSARVPSHFKRSLRPLKNGTADTVGLSVLCAEFMKWSCKIRKKVWWLPST